MSKLPSKIAFKLDLENRSSTPDDEDDGEEEEDDFVSKNQKPLFQLKESSASFNVSDLRSIIFGGSSSRFWTLRKHLNCLPQHYSTKTTKMPFYSWECITLQLEGRDVNLVIKDEGEMMMFLKFLSYEMQSVDGTYGSGENFIKKESKKKIGNMTRV